MCLMITNITFENMHYGGYAKLSMLDKFEWVQFAFLNILVKASNKISTGRFFGKKRFKHHF